MSLIIDTSSDRPYFAFDKVIFLPSARDLIEAIEETGITPREICIGLGPGSFTGTRIGVMTARSLAFARKIPLKGFCSLHAFTGGPLAYTKAAGKQGHFISIDQSPPELVTTLPDLPQASPDPDLEHIRKIASDEMIDIIYLNKTLSFPKITAKPI